MVSIAEFTVPADGFPLGAVFAGPPGASVELERIVPSEPGLVPYLWVRGASVADLETAADGHSLVRELTLVDEVDGTALYKGVWNDDVPGVLQGIVESGLTLLSARSNGGVWRFEFRADDRESIGAFRAYCREHDVPVTMGRVHTLAMSDVVEAYGLTDRQEEALRLALERGYFDEPRRATLSDLADELGISRQAVAARLRRGHRRLLGHTIGDPRDSTGGDGDPG